MANLKEIQEFLENLSKTDIQRVELKTNEIEINVQLKPDCVVTNSNNIQPQQIPVISHQNTVNAPINEVANTQKEEDNSLLPIKSPMVGTFYRKPSPDKPAFVEKGQIIKKGDVVCIIEAMKLFNEIESEISGEIVEILVDDASPVEFDQVLFIVKQQI